MDGGEKTVQDLEPMIKIDIIIKDMRILEILANSIVCV